jgi:hypothetical protein
VPNTEREKEIERKRGHQAVSFLTTAAAAAIVIIVLIFERFDSIIQRFDGKNRNQNEKLTF